MSYKVEVQADGSGDWASNALRFPNQAEASAYAVDLVERWTAVKDWRIVLSKEPVNHRYPNGEHNVAN